MTTIQGVIFVALLVMVLVWFYCIYRLKRQLLQRHPDTHEEMGLSDLWSAMASGENHRPTRALLNFLFRKEYVELDDPQISSLAIFMRWFMWVYIGLFGYLAYSISWPARPAVEPIAATAAATSASLEERRHAAYDLHRALKWPQAIAAYDALLRDGGDDAETLYWRGMAKWKSAQFDAALRDFLRVAELDPRHLEAHRNADRLLSKQQRWDEVLALWDRYIAHQPRDAEAYFERGGTFFHKGRIEAARADAKKACDLGKAQACTMVEKLKDK